MILLVKVAVMRYIETRDSYLKGKKKKIDWLIAGREIEMTG